MSNELNEVDQEKLDSYRVETIVSGVYLIAWNELVFSGKLPGNIEEYLITFQETDEEIQIYFTRPLKVKILGGGGGLFRISKKTMKVLGGGLAR